MRDKFAGYSALKCHVQRPHPKYRNISKVLPQLKQNLLFSKLIRFHLRVYKTSQVQNVSKSIKELPTRL